ncbi:phage lytic cycle repressor MrpR family protein [Halalkalibacter oceani]|uniref:phage lytic cycle repressor MrpR family protein n=1 Tax=Halalkalibacter oceani TaxID=1653776 RepID=UPI0033975F35
MYNEKIKEAFLKNYDADTAVIYRYKLRGAERNERALQKDLYSFTRAEIEDTLRDMAQPSLGSIAMAANVFKNYIDWASAHGYSNSSINPIANLTRDSLFRLIDHSKKQFLTEEELAELEDKKLVNGQDKVVFRLLFEGLKGSQLSEIRNLHYKDIDFDNNIIKVRGEMEREVKVSDRCLRIITEAYKESVYIVNNGESVFQRANPEKKLIRNDFIIRSIDNGRVLDENAPVGNMTLYTRVKMLKKFFDYPYLTPTNIARSGMIKVGKDIYEETGELTNNDLRTIVQNFGHKKSKLQGKMDYNLIGIKEDVNIENIKKLYEI